MKSNVTKRAVFIPAVALMLATIASGAGASELRWRLAQQGDIMTATAASTTQPTACENSINTARNFCTIRGFNRISKVRCECNQNNSPGALAWECIGYAACEK
jgi:hypothetical protein